MLAEINEWGESVRNLSTVKIGSSHVYLDGDEANCRLGECSLGNMLADAMISETLTYPDEERWNHVSFAVMNGGGIRASIQQGI